MKFRLLGDHVTAEQQVIAGGTVVGDDTPWSWRDADGKPLPVTTTMEGLDDEGREMVSALHRQLYGKDRPYWEEPDAAREAHEKQAEEQQKLDEGSEPVSEQQRLERNYEKDRKEGKRGEADMAPTIPPRAPVTATPGAARQPSHTATASPTTGGTTRPAPGPATPQPPKEDEVRPKKPNEEQYPKG